MKTRIPLLQILMLIGLFLIASSQGFNLLARAADNPQAVTIRYLAPTGSDTGDCTSASNPCQTLQYGINQSVAGDELRLAQGTYSSMQALNGHNQMAWIDKSLGLYGGFNATFTSRSSDNTTTILDAADQGRIIFASGAITLTLDTLKMVNGTTTGDPGWFMPGGGIYADGVNLIVNNSQLNKNHTGTNYGDGGYGSGLYLKQGSLKMDRSVVQENSSLGNDVLGGGLYATGSTVEITNSSFLTNTAGITSIYHIGVGYGGGAYLESSNVVIQGTTFRGNLGATGPGGEGGGLYTLKGTLHLLDSTFDSNVAANLTGNSWGGGLFLGTANAEVRGNTFINNSAPDAGGAIFIRYYWGSTLTGNRFENNHSDGGGGAVNAYEFGPLQIENNQFIGNSAGSGGALGLSGPSTASSQVTLRGNLLQNNQSTGSGGALSYYGTVDLLYNQFIGNHANGSGGAVAQGESGEHAVGNAVIEGNLLRGNSAGANGGGLYIGTTYSADLITAYRNMAFIDNHAGGKGGAIYIYRYTNAPTPFSHLTFSGNTAGDNTTINIFGGRLELTNIIIANAQVGILLRGRLALDHILFDGVTTPVTNEYGVISKDIRVSGSAALDADAYHLTGNSAAVDAGVDAGLIYDIDEQPRPMGTAPDLGADESPFSLGYHDLQAWMLKSQPEWKIQYTGTSVPPSTVFEQTYLIPFANYNPTLSVNTYSLHDLFPAPLNLVSNKFQPNLTFTSSGNSLNWSSLNALQPGYWGWIDIGGRSDSVTPGTVLITSGQMDYTLSDNSTGSIPFSAETTVPPRPLFAPLLLSPRNGEMCLDEAHQLTANGLSSAGGIVKLYENGILKATVTANSDGEYNMTWVSVLSETQSVDVHTVACEPGGSCSSPSSSVHLKYPEGNWCPQRSYWEGDAYGIHYEFHFRNEDGAYATQDFLIPGTAGFINTKLHLYSCCKGEANPFRVLSDGKTYDTPVGHNGHWWEFDIETAHNVAIYSDCSGGGTGTTSVSYGTVLIDPDGFVFNQAQSGSIDPITHMFTPVQPLEGFTVTAYYWAPEWNTWIVWPAQLYDNQVNPQVTKSNGYFAFFTPPGQYYLQVTGKDGYQSWRSPIVEVKSEVVHMNAPLTAWDQNTSVPIVKVSPSGLSQPWITIPVGGKIGWQAAIDILSSADTLNQLMTNPLQRLLSTFDPIFNPLGWDSGRMVPGESYYRQFDQAGVYSYTDGYGHSGQVNVGNEVLIYFPIVKR